MSRTGVTLLELLVVLAILGVMLGVSGLSLATLRVPRASERVRTLRAARVEAIQSGKSVQVHFDSTRTAGPPVRRSVLFLPDGRAIGPDADPLTGAPVAAKP